MLGGIAGVVVATAFALFVALHIGAMDAYAVDGDLKAAIAQDGDAPLKLCNLQAGSGDAEAGSGLTVSIDYRPVPAGKYAELVAAPNRHIGSGSYNLQWQYSADGGEGSWKDVEGGTVQTLRVLADGGHIGMHYRVVLTSELLNEKDENRVAISDPVQIMRARDAEDYFSVTLGYDPPIAGDVAPFTPIVTACDKDGNPNTINPKNLTYTWEMKTAATGSPWVTISHGRRGSLVIPTDPVDDSASESDGISGDQLTYIRVRARTPTSASPKAAARPCRRPSRSLSTSAAATILPKPESRASPKSSPPPARS